MRQLRYPQTAEIRTWLTLHPLPRPLHADRLTVDEPSRAVVRPANGKLIRRGVQTSVQALESQADIRDWIATWNDNPRPFTLTETADEILNSLAEVGAGSRTTSKTNQRNF